MAKRRIYKHYRMQMIYAWKKCGNTLRMRMELARALRGFKDNSFWITHMDPMTFCGITIYVRMPWYMSQKWTPKKGS
jgi:hypothetical protein